jgi:hypothetical protein
MNNRGSYGFRMKFPDAAEPPRDLTECEPTAPTVVLRWRLAVATADHAQVNHDRVSFGAKGGSSMFIDRDPPEIMFHLAEVPVPDALVHPLGTIPLAILARWRGDVTLHAGAFATSTGAWAVVGHREAGKSTLLASLADRGVPLLADDLLAVLDGLVWPGPGCVDLRPDAAPCFAGARDLGIVSGRRRFRLSTASETRRLPLAGIFVLGWHDQPGVLVEPLSAEERLRLLYDLEYVALVGPANPHSLMDLVEVPAWRVVRPRDWTRIDASLDAIMNVAATYD